MPQQSSIWKKIFIVRYRKDKGYIILAKFSNYMFQTQGKKNTTDMPSNL